jgi:hypothetical protein
LGFGRGKKRTVNENLHNEKCRDWYSSSNTIGAIKPKRIQWVRARNTYVGDEKCTQGIAKKNE